MPAEPLDPLVLLERSERVRELARHILGRTDGAEDVAQDALVASLGWRDVDDGSLQARLAAQVRSLASRWRRTGARRARREAAAARRDESPSSSELYERADMQRTLVEAVLALEEPYRECVILRYFEGLPPRAIADLRSLPVRTVQTRLARALTQLRARLERRVDLSAWVPLLVPLAVRPAAPLPLPSSGLGVLALATSKWAVSLFAVALIGAAVFVLRPGGVFDSAGPGAGAAQGPQPAVGESVGATVTGEVAAGAEGESRASAAAASATSAADADAPPDRDLDLFGDVVDVYGQPLAGVELNALEPVRAVSDEDCEPREGGVVLASTRSDGEGCFRLRLERGQECTLEARLPSLATARLTERRAGERVRVVLGPPAAVWGRVTRAGDGSGVAGARIWLRLRPPGFTNRMVCTSTETDAAGSYAFDGLTAGSYDIWATCAEDPSLWPPPIELASGQSLERDFVVPIGVDISGRVVDANTGEGLADAEVSLHPFFERSSRTSADGSYLLRGWDVNAHGISVHARAAGFAPAQRSLPRGAPGAGVVELALAREAALTGRILDPFGAPQPEASVEVYGARIGPNVRRDLVSVRTGSDGRFEVRGLSRDQPHTLVASAPGAGRLIVDLLEFDAAREPRELGDLALPVECRLAGQVVDAAGRPLAEAFVTLVGGDPGRNRLRAIAQAAEFDRSVTPTLQLRVDDLGRFHANGLSHGEYAVSAHVTGTMREALANVSLREGEHREGVQLALDLGLRISGTVTGPEGEAIAFAILDAIPTRADAGREAAMVTRADGSFDLGGLTAGAYVLSVAHFESGGGRPYCGVRVEGVVAGTEDLRIVLPVAAPISGVVLAVDGAPLPGASVQVDYGDGRVGGTGTTITDALGRFRLLVPEDVKVDLLAADWSRVAEGASAVRLGRVQRIEPGTSELTIRIEP